MPICVLLTNCPAATQDVLNNMKGVGEPHWDDEDALADGWIYQGKIWGGETCPSVAQGHG
jgi:hypothetical protein